MHSFLARGGILPIDRLEHYVERYELTAILATVTEALCLFPGDQVLERVGRTLQTALTPQQLVLW